MTAMTRPAPAGGVSLRKRIWGWMFFDWANQPLHTLLVTFIFGPYFAEVARSHFMSQGLGAQAAGAEAQTLWSWGLTFAGIVIALSAPFLGAYADAIGNRIRWIVLFSAIYAVATSLLWFTYPDGSTLWLALLAFVIGFMAGEFTAIFTNALLPSLGSDNEIGGISGSGFAFGYWGGVLSLVIFLVFFQDDGTGKTLVGLAPCFGLCDTATREGTRFVGPFAALWYVLFMIPFFMWVKEEPEPARPRATFREALTELGKTIRSLAVRRSLAAYLGSSMLYRDALNGLYGFGGVYAKLVLGWAITSIGIFGIIGAITAAVFSWIGGLADRRWGPKPVIITCIVILTLVCAVIVGMSRESFFGIPLAEGSSLPDIVFFLCGGVIGGAGGALQAASRTMMVRHTHPDWPTEAFGLYALSGKATAFLAPGLIGIFTTFLASPRLGVSPLIGLFALSLLILDWVRAEGDRDLAIRLKG